MPICTYQYYCGSGENAALGKCGPGGGLEILTENVGHGGVTGGFSRGSRGGSREVLGWFSGGSRVVLGVVLAHKTYSKPRNYHARNVYKKTGMETGANFA